FLAVARASDEASAQCRASDGPPVQTASVPSLVTANQPKPLLPPWPSVQPRAHAQERRRLEQPARHRPAAEAIELDREHPPRRRGRQDRQLLNLQQAT